MRNISLILLALTLFVSCAKKNDRAIEPDLNGTYNINALRNLNGETIQFPTYNNGKIDITSEVEVTLPAKNRIDLMRKGNAAGKSYIDYLGQYEIKKNGTSGYDIFLDSKIIGSIDGKNMYLDFQGKSKNTNIVTISAKRI